MNQNELRVGQSFRIRRNGNPYMIDRIANNQVEIRNIYNGATDIRPIEDFVEQINTVPQQ